MASVPTRSAMPAQRVCSGREGGKGGEGGEGAERGEEGERGEGGTGRRGETEGIRERGLEGGCSFANEVICACEHDTSCCSQI